METIQKLVMSKNKIAGGSWIRGTTVRERERHRERQRERERQQGYSRRDHAQSTYKGYELSKS